MQGFLDALMTFMSNPQNAALVGTGLGLAISAAHVRGYKTPVLSYLLDFLHGQNPAIPDNQAPVAPVAPSQPALTIPANHPLLNDILLILRRQQNVTPAAPATTPATS